jgi:hypothetical protein
MTRIKLVGGQIMSFCANLGKGTFRRCAVLGAIALGVILTFTAPLSATTLLTNGSTLIFNGNAQVGATFLNWLCNQPGAPTAGCGSTAGNIAVASSTGTFAALNGDFGYIKDINEAGQPVQNVPFPTLANFITFVTSSNVALPNITLDLTELPEGTDTQSATCAGLSHCTPTSAAFVNPNNPGGVSAFNLDYNSTVNSTTASFSFMGIVRDNVPGDNPSMAAFTGTFSEPIANTTPQELLATIANGGTVTAAYGEQGSLTINTVPEPGTTALVLGGVLLLLGKVGMRHFNRSR